MLKRPNGFELTPRDGPEWRGVKGVSLKMLRNKNKFLDLDPTHFRNALCNLTMDVEWDGSVYPNRPPTLTTLLGQRAPGIIQRAMSIW